ncbi:hypothetical protein NDU88_004186 [Pleurodeles waltl]|uniref:Uncharacterized protein n=1 Tax=Pleurodeles waltl TaxID=8319 RepID=A0AAV7WWZ4_PLEWA|nr:hypothetical protein NDU88_004186 [Pleurodeles waltl]
MHSLPSGGNITSSPNRNDAVRLPEWKSMQRQCCDRNFDALPTGSMHRQARMTQPNFLRGESMQCLPCNRKFTASPTRLTQLL